MCLAQGHSTATPVRLEHAAPRSRKYVLSPQEYYQGAILKRLQIGIWELIDTRNRSLQIWLKENMKFKNKKNYLS